MFSTLLVSGALRAAAVLFLALVACAALARASAATRRAVLVLALGAALVVPVVAAIAPAWRVAPAVALALPGHESLLEGAAPAGVRAPAAAVPSAMPSAAPLAPPAEARVDLGTVLLAVWLAGAALLLARALGAQRRARRLARTGELLPTTGAIAAALREAGVTRGVDVRICAGVDSPAVTGLGRATVLLPPAAAGWAPEQLRLVLVHELAHVRRRDALAQLLADAACAVHWFNPLAWLVAARLRVERELAADDAVLAAGVRPSRYAEALLAMAGATTAGALAMAERTTLGARVIAILATRRARSPLAARGTALLVAGGVAVAAIAACASSEARPSAPAAAAPAAPAPSAALDPAAQAAADEVLAAVAADGSAESAVVLVLDPATGEILADAGRVGDRAVDVARSRAIEPGSTLKPIVFAAALDAGAITAAQRIDCGPGPRAYGADAIRDSAPNGTLDVAHVLAVSSNIGASHIFDALGGDRLGAALARFHVGGAPGAVPATITTGTYAGAVVAMGGGLTATPLQMASAYAALADGGVYHAPTAAREASPGERLVSAATASQIMSMLETAVVDDEATGSRARVDGVRVAGKTGTADFTSADGRAYTYASFIGVADLPGRRVVALVGVETQRAGVSGGSLAAPAFAQLITRLRR